MKSNITIVFIFFLFSCGGDNATNPATGPNYHSDDNTFLTQLVNSNTIEMDSLENRITVASIEIAGEKFDRIVSLDLSNLALDELPTSVDKMEYLEELNLATNLFSDLPEELCTVSARGGIAINIDNNLLCDPTGITHCILNEISVDFEKQNCTKVKHDQEMDFLLKFINDNNLDSVSSEIFKEVKWAWAGTDSALTGDGKQIERILEIKWVQKNLTTIPGEIGDLKYLLKLELEDNNLERLPAEMKFLESLEDLQIQENSLKALPDKIGLISNLLKLNIRGNDLVELPQSIGNLSKLEYLNIGYNKLESLPDTLCGLLNANLQILIDCNQLDSTVVNTCLYDELGDQKDHENCSGD